MLVDSLPGLSLFVGGVWTAPLELGQGEVVVMGGRALELLTAGRCRGCRHRLPPPRATRVSLVCEALPTAMGASATQVRLGRHRAAEILVLSLGYQIQI